MWFKAIRHAALVSVALQKCGQLLPNGDVKKLGVAADQQKWQRLGDKWKQKFPWLDAGISHIDGKWGVGCSDCYQAKRHGCSFARYTVRGEAALQCINFKKHDGNGTHTAASKHRSSDTHKCQDDQDFDVVNAPSREDFRKVISDIQKGLTPGCDRKSRAEQWCLLEGIKIIDQKHLEAAKGISLFRDESQGRLSLRFRSVGPAPKFETYSALMGQARDCGTGAKNITLGTIAIIERACSRFSGGDKSRCHQKEIVLKPLFKKVKKNIRCITVDSAGDELLSGEMMRNRSLIGSMKVHTPNLKYVIKDCTHASRRLGSRPTAADPYLKEVILMMVRSRSSMARIIQNSSEVQRIFKGHCKTSFRCIRNIVANMKSALHRFESMSKPLGRSCIFLHAMIKTALTLATVRTDEVGKRAGQWLMWLDTEKCLQSAMMADGHDQNLAFTRILDDEAVPAAVLNREASFFVAAIDELYVGDNPTCLKVFGYTSLMLEMLSRPLVWTYKNKINSIGHSGGVPQFIIDACLRRMCNWVYLAKATVYAAISMQHAWWGTRWQLSIIPPQHPFVARGRELLEPIARGPHYTVVGSHRALFREMMKDLFLLIAGEALTHTGYIETVDTFLLLLQISATCSTAYSSRNMWLQAILLAMHVVPSGANCACSYKTHDSNAFRNADNVCQISLGAFLDSHIDADFWS